MIDELCQVSFFNRGSEEKPSPSSKVLSVGQCGVDHGSISRVFERKLGVKVTGAGSADATIKALGAGGYQLILINRILDADGTSGLELVRRIKADSQLADIPIMLVSNYPEAQSQAEALGALPGFGKSNLDAEPTLQRLRELLEVKIQTSS